MFAQSSLELIAFVAGGLTLLGSAIIMIGGLVLIIYDILDQFLP